MSLNKIDFISRMNPNFKLKFEAFASKRDF